MESLIILHLLACTFACRVFLGCFHCISTVSTVLTVYQLYELSAVFSSILCINFV